MITIAVDKEIQGIVPIVSSDVAINGGLKVVVGFIPKTVIEEECFKDMASRNN